MKQFATSKKKAGADDRYYNFFRKEKKLTLKTVWIIKKEQHISQPTNAEALIRTPEARSSMDAVPKNIINDPSEDVNRKLKNSFDKNNLPQEKRIM